MATVSICCGSEIFCALLHHSVMLLNLYFVNKNECKFFLVYRRRLYRACSWENTGFVRVTSYQGTQFSPYLLPVCLEEGPGTLLGCPDSGGPLLAGVMTSVWPCRGEDRIHS